MKKKTEYEFRIESLKAQLNMAIMGNFIMRRAWLEAEIKKLEAQIAKP